MATGFRWVRVQLPERLHRQMTKGKGAASWDLVVEEALAAWLDARREAANFATLAAEGKVQR